jgi:leucyl aminopeptidase (aminopeptidase T)
MQSSPTATEAPSAVAPVSGLAKPVVKAVAKSAAQAAAKKPVVPASKRPAAKAAIQPVAPSGVKSAIKASAKPATKPNAKPAVKSTTKAAAKLVAKAVAAKPAKEKKIKMVRDSISIPKTEYAVLEAMKLRAAKQALPVKKTELIRAGIKALAALPDAAFLSAVRAVPSLKTGRPPKAA